MIYGKTAAGQAALRDRSVALTPRQRSAFILFDGKRQDTEVLAATGAQALDVDHLVALGLLEPVAAQPRVAVAAVAMPGAVAAPAPAAANAAASGAVPASPSGRSDQERYLQAYPIATKLTSALGLRGFRLNLAVEAAGGLPELRALAPKILDAVGAIEYEPLRRALDD